MLTNMSASGKRLPEEDAACGIAHEEKLWGLAQSGEKCNDGYWMAESGRLIRSGAYLFGDTNGRLSIACRVM
jgi:hypothetical protein